MIQIDENIIRNIERIIGEKVNTIEKNNSGFTKVVYTINKQYILKLVPKADQKENIINEIDFLTKSDLYFVPKIIYADLTKNEVPYIYYLEEKKDGEELLMHWGKLSENERKNVLNELMVKIKMIHDVKNPNKDYLLDLLYEYDICLNNLIQSGIIIGDKINYLKEIGKIIPTLFDKAKTGLIHGDLHFNNILINSKNEISIIDFGKVNFTYLEREFDPIYRMARNPNSFVNSNNIKIQNTHAFQTIIPYIQKKYNDIADEQFMDRILLYDCINSMIWLPCFPNHNLYVDILFEKSKKLLK